MRDGYVLTRGPIALSLSLSLTHSLTPSLSLSDLNRGPGLICLEESVPVWREREKRVREEGTEAETERRLCFFISFYSSTNNCFVEEANMFKKRLVGFRKWWVGEERKRWVGEEKGGIC